MDPAPDAMTPQGPESVNAVTRLYLGDELSLASLAPFVEKFRLALSQTESAVEIDGSDLAVVTEAARLFFEAELERAFRRGVRIEIRAAPREAA